MKKIIIIVILCLFMVTGCSYNEVESKMISVKDVNDIIENFENEEDTFIVDVRELNEYEEGHLNGAINIPTYDLYREASRKLTDKDAIIIAYCTVGVRSENAINILRKMGYKNLYHLDGGIG